MRGFGAVASVVAGALLVTGCGRAAAPYVEANAHLLALAPPYPGAKLLRLESDPYRAPDEELGPTIGYTTLATYALARPVAGRTVAAFYARELRGWRERVTTIPCRPVAPPPGAAASGHPLPARTR